MIGKEAEGTIMVFFGFFFNRIFPNKYQSYSFGGQGITLALTFAKTDFTTYTVCPTTINSTGGQYIEYLLLR